jgi:hypothetical protein
LPCATIIDNIKQEYHTSLNLVKQLT